ncbi:MAG: potassium transporter [Phycisphaerales bacterium]|nr:potassium transporter [Phycisphaerales bacterium]
MRKTFWIVIGSLISAAALWLALSGAFGPMPAGTQQSIHKAFENKILLLLLEIALILGLSRVVGMLFARMRQPQVVGEMVAGIMLGPSLLGLIGHGAVQHALFPAGNVELLNVLSQLGVIFFLFLVGLELEPGLLRSGGRATVVTAAGSIVVPFALGVLLTLVLYRTGIFNDPSHEKRLGAALFMGAAMGITAFPVLARILTERNLHKTKLGAAAIAIAAINDVAAWVILAFVIAIAHASGPASGLRTAGLSAVYAAAMLFGVRPFLRRLQMVYDREGHLSQNVVAIIFLLVLASAWATEAIGIHAMFGAFLLGCVMPKGTQFVRHVTEKLEDYTVVFLLPIFFAYTGLKTQIGLLNDARLWAFTGVIIAIACAGKFGGTSLLSRAFGSSWREASALGVLMNTRGLVELVILTVGLQLGIINDTVFAMMVIMALVTTFMTTPLLHWVYPHPLLEATRPAEAKRGYSILIPVAAPRSGRPLLQLADALGRTGAEAGRILALHLRRPVEREAYRAGVSRHDEPVIQDPLGPLLALADEEHIPVESISLMSRDVADGIAHVAGERRPDLVLIGFHKPVFTRSILGGTVHRVMEQVKSDVAVLVDRGFANPRRVLVPYMGGPHDRLALDLAARYAKSANVEVTVLHVVDPARSRGKKLDAQGAMDRSFKDSATAGMVTLRVVESGSPVETVIAESHNFDLVMIGVSQEWGLAPHRFGWHPERIASESATSLLIVRRYGDAPATATAQEPLPDRSPARVGT